MIELADKQRRAVDGSGEPVCIRDPKANRDYVLMPREAYERLRRLLDAEVVGPSFYEFEEADNP